MEEKKLGLKSVISVSVGLVIATSCLVSLGQGAGTIGVTFIFAMVIACLFNMTTIASLSELNALMPNTTGGLAQYTLACLGPFPTMISMVGGYLFCNVLSSGVEASIFAYAMGEIFHLPIPNFSYTVLVTVILLIANLKGVDMFAKIQDAVAYLMVGSMVIMGVIGMLGLGTGKKISQPMVLSADWKTIVSMTAVAFWLFIGAEYVIPISKDVKNAKRNVPLGMFLGLGLICVVQSILVFGFHNYTPWDKLADSAAPHLLYGENLLGNVGKIWMAGCAEPHAGADRLASLFQELSVGTSHAVCRRDHDTGQCDRSSFIYGCFGKSICEYGSGGKQQCVFVCFGLCICLSQRCGWSVLCRSDHSLGVCVRDCKVCGNWRADVSFYIGSAGGARRGHCRKLLSFVHINRKGGEKRCLLFRMLAKVMGNFQRWKILVLRWSMGFTECLPQTVRERQLS